MPRLEVIETYGVEAGRLIALFRSPREVVGLAPADLGLRLVDGPDVVEVGSRVTVEARRWGLTQRIVTEVVELLPGVSLIEEQRRGPFRHWRHERHFRDLPGGGCELREVIEFEPPGGLLGLTLTAARIEADLRAGFDARRAALIERFGSAITAHPKPDDTTAR